MKTKIGALLLCFGLLLTGCGKQSEETGLEDPNKTEVETPGSVADLGDENKAFGEALENLGLYEGFFENESDKIEIQCVSGTDHAYKLDGSTLTFTAIEEQTVYAVSGTFKGNIVVDVGDDHKFDLELHGLSLVCDTTNPITVKSGDEVAIKAKKDTQNYIYDMRAAVDESDETIDPGAIYAEVDLEMSGKGSLYVISENNNGIHTKDDLQVKNLTLLVACVDNALKGNDGVEVEGGTMTLIASGGDCIKTSNSDVSQKGKQRGVVSITGGTHTLYAACDGIDAAYDFSINDPATVLNIYTDQYSTYSKEVTETSSDVNYIRFTSNRYFYSVKYYNSDTDYVWVNATYHSSVSGGRSTYYYYSYPKKPAYTSVQFFLYEAEEQQGQESDYVVMSDYLAQNSAYDTFALSQSYGGLGYQWTNYTTKIQEGGFGGRPGGFSGGNSDKADYSTKGIKASNEIVIYEGTIHIKSYDDALHANKDTVLENGTASLGNVTINGGNLTLYSNDDGIHADGILAIKAGTVSIVNAYEGLEGIQVNIEGGFVSIFCKDDGINATATSGSGIEISGGEVYAFCTGDGLDANSRTADAGIVFSGGKTVVIANSNMNSAIDTENGYTYAGGQVVVVMPRGGMANEATQCRNFSEIGKSVQISLTNGEYLVVETENGTATVQMPASLSALVVVLGDKAAKIRTASEVSAELNQNGVAWS